MLLEAPSSWRLSSHSYSMAGQGRDHLRCDSDSHPVYWVLADSCDTDALHIFYHSRVRLHSTAVTFASSNYRSYGHRFLLSSHTRLLPRILHRELDLSCCFPRA